MVGRRPEHMAPPEVVYNASAAFKYRTNNRMNRIQKDMAIRALELLEIAPIPSAQRSSGRSGRRPRNATPLHILDVGCGIGLSGEVIEEYGHYWQGVDISREMVSVGLEKRTEDDHLDNSNDSMIVHDIGRGLPFRPASFDAVISISTLQWLCNADQSEHVPQKRLKRFFESLFMCLVHGGRAVFQLYPENDKQMHMIMHSAKRAGFGGGMVVDYPNSSTAKKHYLVLQTDSVHARMASTPNPTPQAAPVGSSRKRSRADPLMENSSDSGETSMSDASEDEVSQAEDTQTTALTPQSAQRRAERKKRMQMRRTGWKPKRGTRSWILQKKEKQRKIGKKTAGDSKYTGRKRRKRF